MDSLICGDGFMIKITKDGRTIRSDKDYTRLRASLWVNQNGKCISCVRPTSLTADLIADYSFHVAHRGSRGLGGSLRDDVVGEKKGQIEGGKCGFCHRCDDHNQQSRVPSQLQWSKS